LLEEDKQKEPVFRDVETDSLDTVILKRMIRTRSLVVLYYFKDRLGDNDFLYVDNHLERERYSYVGCRLISEETQEAFQVTSEAQGAIIRISTQSLQGLKEGYYRLDIDMYDSVEKGNISNGLYLYVAESDSYENKERFIQNTTFTYYGTEGEQIHLFLRNESRSTITELLDKNRSPIDKRLYRILFEGRVLELSNEFLKEYCTEPTNMFYVRNSEDYVNSFTVANGQ